MKFKVVLFVLVVPFLFAASAYAQTQQQGTGLLPETEKGKAWIKEHIKEIRSMKPNAIAMARINSMRLKKKLPAMQLKNSELASINEEAIYKGEPLASVKSGAEKIFVSSLPTSVDNSTLSAFPPIRSQGALGSCAAWATTYYQYSYEANLTLGNTASSGDNNYIFSPKWTYNMINGGTDGGSWFSDAYNLLSSNGAATWAQFPYDTNYLEWKLDPDVWRNALKIRMSSSGGGSVLNQDSNGFSTLKQILTNGHILTFATFISSFHVKALGDDPGTSADDSFAGQNSVYYMDNTHNGGHAMTIVGYNDDLWTDVNGNGTVESGEKGAFKIANSWGAGWGNSGYIWVSYDALRNTSTVSGAPSGRESVISPLYGGYAYWITATSETPKIIAHVTLNHAKRGQIRFGFGYGAAGDSNPNVISYPGALSYSGGNYAFDGTTTAVDGTFVFDFGPWVASPGVARKYWIQGIDSTSGSPLLIKSFKLIDSTGTTLTDSNMSQLSIDASLNRVGVDYTLATPIPTATPTPTPTSIPTAEPTASPVPTASPTSAPEPRQNALPVARIIISANAGYAPLSVIFDGRSSSDEDGEIVNYFWEFGDGQTAEGPVVSHAYSRIGTFLPRLTVNDDLGGEGSLNGAVVVTEKNPLKSPSKVTAKLKKRSIQLSWRDNTSNENGFIIERGQVKRNGSTVFKKVGTVKANKKAFSQSLGRGTFAFRVRSYRGKIQSEPSNQVKVAVK